MMVLRTSKRIGAATEIELEDATEIPRIAAAPDARFASRMAISARRISTKLIAHMGDGAASRCFRGIQEGCVRRECPHCPASVKGDILWRSGAGGRDAGTADIFAGAKNTASQRLIAEMKCDVQRPGSTRMSVTTLTNGEV